VLKNQNLVSTIGVFQKPIFYYLENLIELGLGKRDFARMPTFIEEFARYFLLGETQSPAVDGNVFDGGYVHTSIHRNTKSKRRRAMATKANSM